MHGLVALVVLAIFALSGVKMRRFREQRRVRGRVRALPELTAGMAEGTTVRITGVVRALEGSETLSAPLSGRPCVLYRVNLGGGPLAAMPSKRVRASLPGGVDQAFDAIVPFLVDRGDAGVAIVDGAHAELDLPPTRSWEVDDRLCAEFSRVHGLRRDQIGSSEEVILMPGATVTVVGFAMADIATEAPQGERGFRDDAPTRLRITGTRERPLFVSRDTERDRQHERPMLVSR